MFLVSFGWTNEIVFVRWKKSNLIFTKRKKSNWNQQIYCYWYAKNVSFQRTKESQTNTDRNLIFFFSFLLFVNEKSWQSENWFKRVDCDKTSALQFQYCSSNEKVEHTFGNSARWKPKCSRADPEKKENNNNNSTHTHNPERVERGSLSERFSERNQVAAPAATQHNQPADMAPRSRKKKAHGKY